MLYGMTDKVEYKPNAGGRNSAVPNSDASASTKPIACSRRGNDSGSAPRNRR